MMVRVRLYLQIGSGWSRTERSVQQGLGRVLVIKHEMIRLTEYMCPKVHHRSLYCFKTGVIKCGPFLRH